MTAGRKSLSSRLQRRRKQRLALHRSMLLALLLVHGFIFVARFIRITSVPTVADIEKHAEAIRLEEILLKQPPPPPVTPPPAVKVREPEPVPDKITTPIRPVRVPKRPPHGKEQAPKMTLDVDVSDPTLHSGPQLDLSSRYYASRNPAAESGVELGLDAPAGPDGVAHDAGPGLDLQTPEVKDVPAAKPEPAQAEFHLDEPHGLQAGRQKRQASDVPEDLLQADVSLVLASTDLSMGVEEYKIWNRINAEFDRWDKGRYGPLAPALRRRGRALIARFRLGDGTALTVIWLRGNTKILVQSDTRQSRLQLLQRALNAIIQLNLKRSGL